MKRALRNRQAENTNSSVPVPPEEEEDLSKKSKMPGTKKRNKLSFQNLTNNYKNSKAETKKIPKSKSLRATVDLEAMKEELKQLEDPPVTDEEKKIGSNKLPYSFFDAPCKDLAQKLLGKILVRRLENGTLLKGRIVETEAYLGEMDRASQTHGGRVTPRNLPMYMAPGTIYVYLTYGMYHCFNISSGGKGCAILLRALEPITGIEAMREHRISRLKSSTGKSLKIHEICNGPSKLCIAMEIDRNLCKYSICNYRSMWIENDNDSEDFKIVKSARIGIDSVGPEWASKPLRYYIYGNESVSKRDKKAEGAFVSGD